jgi:NADH-quinone oxidoreductase subunit G
MVEIEVDGKKVEVNEGSMVMHAANALGIFVPHFCYHKKLSIAANCRMCLVDVEKAPKPLPACATPVSAGMKVWTHSERAIKAQKGVMEFLLINHPLDCPICDQGGECQLQDLAVGYGASASRYTEEKRVVFHKSVGPLISAEEMTRCIHCTRCVRFGQEIAGVMELGMAGRGEHSEIMSFVGRGIESELSGNMIDVCPVGALTSKPFRYSARTWELSRRKSVAPHDSLGSNLVVQIKQNAVMRVLPFENESINECWLSDRDRFAYEGLNSAERLERPMLRQDGRWVEVDWQVALDYAAHALGSVRQQHGAAAIGALASPQATLEELYLLGRLARTLGTENVDARPRAADPTLAARMNGAPWLGMPIEAVNGLDRMLLVGSFLRKDHPMLSARVRAAARRGARVAVLHAVDDELLMPVAARAIVPPSDWAATLAAALVALLQSRDEVVPAELAGVTPTDAARALAATLSQGKAKAVFLGNAVAHHPQAAAIAALAQALAAASGATLGWLVDGANAVGAHLAGALPGAGGLDAAAMVAQPLKGYLLLGLEPEHDHGNPGAVGAALAAADTVVALTAYRSAELMASADCLLPITPFTETAGTFVNCAGTVQSFNGVVRPRGEARPAWKVLRVLGNLLSLPGFDQDSAEAVRAQALPADLASRLSNAVSGPIAVPAAAAGLQRVADVPIYSTDPIVRRAPSLQLTRDAAVPRARMNAATLAGLALASGDALRVRQATTDGAWGEALLEAELDARVADGTVRIAAAHESTARLGPMFGPISVERAP